MDWLDGVNGVILGLQNDINNDVFGYVINVMKVVNNIFNIFEDEISKVVEVVFKDIVLFNVVRDIVGCVIL